MSLYGIALILISVLHLTKTFVVETSNNCNLLLSFTLLREMLNITSDNKQNVCNSCLQLLINVLNSHLPCSLSSTRTIYIM